MSSSGSQPSSTSAATTSDTDQSSSKVNASKPSSSTPTDNKLKRPRSQLEENDNYQPIEETFYGDSEEEDDDSRASRDAKRLRTSEVSQSSNDSHPSATTNMQDNGESSESGKRRVRRDRRSDEEAGRPEEGAPRTSVKPSRVLFFRNLPPNCKEVELNQIVQNYGGERILILRHSKQAFVEFKTVENAQKFLTETGGKVPLRDRQAYMSFSERQEIEAPAPSSGQKQEKQNAILLATVSDNTHNYPINTDVFHRIFSRFGNVQKIVTFTGKSGMTQALIQFPDVRAASTAKSALDGQHIYSGCCKLKIQYSTMTDLNVTKNDDKTKDYTAWNPAPYHMGHVHMDYYGGYPPVHGYYPEDYSYHHSQSPYKSNTPVVLVNKLDSNVKCDDLFILFGVYGDVEKVKILPKKPDTALVEFTNPAGADNALNFLRKGCPLYGSTIFVTKSRHPYIEEPINKYENPKESGFKSYTDSPLHRYRSMSSKNYHHICPPSNIIHISNINSTTSEEKLNQLLKKFGSVEHFEYFGEQKRVTKEGNEIAKKMALVKFSTLDSAVRALVELHYYHLDGHHIKISFSDKKLSSERRSSTSSSSSSSSSSNNAASTSTSAPTTIKREFPREDYKREDFRREAHTDDD